MTLINDRLYNENYYLKLIVNKYENFNAEEIY